ncbi:hypothetical protein ACHHYP_14392, partial [Achlya hypogyna]
YHGNFNAVQFEDWLRKLCTTLARTHGPCIIHLDGAKYHKRQLNPQPTTKWLKADIQTWLMQRRIRFTSTAVKAVLLEITKAHREPAHYACVQIAAEYDHRVLYTPPYHPELQPIEIIWAVAKNRIAVDLAETMDELGQKIAASFSRVTSNTWVKALRKAQGCEDFYMAMADGEALAEDDAVEGDQDGPQLDELVGEEEQ